MSRTIKDGYKEALASCVKAVIYFATEYGLDIPKTVALMGRDLAGVSQDLKEVLNDGLEKKDDGNSNSI